jgi:hypothetical protein
MLKWQSSPNYIIEFLQPLHQYVALLNHVVVAKHNDDEISDLLKNLNFKNNFLNLITEHALNQADLKLVVNNIKRAVQTAKPSFWTEQNHFIIIGGKTLLNWLYNLTQKLPKKAKNGIVKN